MTVKDREKKVSKTMDNSIRNLISTNNDMDIDTQSKENSFLKTKPKDLEELYDIMENINEDMLQKATLNQIRELALEWQNYQDDDTDILSMTKSELQSAFTIWSNEVKNKMDVEVIPSTIKRVNVLIDPSNAKVESDLIDYSEQELIKFHNM